MKTKIVWVSGLLLLLSGIAFALRPSDKFESIKFGVVGMPDEVGVMTVDRTGIHFKASSEKIPQHGFDLTYREIETCLFIDNRDGEQARAFRALSPGLWIFIGSHKGGGTFSVNLRATAGESANGLDVNGFRKALGLAGKNCSAPGISTARKNN